MLKIWTSPKYLAEWLNQSGHQEATARFVDVIETAQQLGALYDEVRKSALRGAFGEGPEGAPVEMRQLDELQGHLKELLSYRPAHLGIEGFIGARLWHGRPEPIAPGSFIMRWMPDDIEGDAAWDEWNAIEAIRQLSEKGDLGRVRRCETCQTWFYAHTALKKFCSPDCKEKKKLSSPAFQEHRRKYHRDYYVETLRIKERMSMSKLQAFVRDSEWKFARTMPKTPHEYTLRAKAPDEKLFKRVVIHIRQFGYKADYRGTTYTYLDIAGWQYWTMGAPLSQTILINRAKLKKGEHL